MMSTLVAHAHLPAKVLTYEDSVYQSLRQDQRLAKLLVLPISNFDSVSKNSQIQALASQTALGGVVIKSGSKASIDRWINTVKKRPLTQRPFVALELAQFFTSPFTDGDSYPLQNQMELLTDTAAVEDIGYLIGKEIKDTGFDAVVLAAKVNEADWWAPYYLQGMRAAGVVMLTDQTARYQWREISYPLVFASQVVATETNGLLWDVKTRKDKGFDGVVVTRPDYAASVSPDFYFDELIKGADMVYLPENYARLAELTHYLTEEKPLKKKMLKEKARQVIALKRNLYEKNTNTVEQRVIDVEEIERKALFNSVVLLENKQRIFPLVNLERYHFASLSGNELHDEIFRDYLSRYASVAHYDFQYMSDRGQQAVQTLQHFDVVFANISSLDLQLDGSVLDILEQIDQHSDVVIVYNGPKSELEKLEKFNTVLWSPQNSRGYAHLMPQTVFGARPIAGRLIVAAQDGGWEQQGEFVPAMGRLRYGDVEALGVDVSKLRQIDIMVKDAIEMGAFPGCQVFMAKNGTVVYNKSFGFQTYDSMVHVNNETIYDIASVTKVAATVPSLMFLHDWGKVTLDDSLGVLPIYHQSDKAGLKVKDLLMHRSGLRSYLPFWQHAEVGPEGDDFRFKLPSRRRRRKIHTTTVVNWADSISYWIAGSKYNSLMKPDGKYDYLYSDLGFMALSNLAEFKLNQPINEFLEQNLFMPLGMAATGYAPLCRFPIDRISPTEQDDHLRNSLVWGQVHDRNAALLGGVAGHAGLFSTAADLGKYMQMQLQNGYYGGYRFFTDSTTALFTQKQEVDYRRSLGWDKPDKEVENASKYASDKAFGHSGFTGTIVWADPEYELVYVFLSNRVYPDAGNNKLIQNNIRTRIHDIMYESFLGR